MIGTNAYKILLESLIYLRDCLEDVGIDGRIMLKWLSYQVGFENMNWIELAKDSVQSWTFMNMMNFGVP